MLFRTCVCAGIIYTHLLRWYMMLFHTRDYNTMLDILSSFYDYLAYNCAVVFATFAAFFHCCGYCGSQNFNRFFFSLSWNYDCMCALLASHEITSVQFTIDSCSACGISNAQFSKLRYMIACRISSIDRNDGILRWPGLHSLHYNFGHIRIVRWRDWFRCVTQAIVIYTDCDRYHFTTSLLLILVGIHTRSAHSHKSFVNCFKRLNLKLEHNKHTDVHCMCICIRCTRFKS